MTRSVAFHSYKGGTGKTTIAANLAAHLARQGSKVYLLDMDVYAPSLHMYFEKEPKAWLNDYLSNDSVSTNDILYDLTPLLQNGSQERSAGGTLYSAFSNPKKEEVNKLESVSQNNLRLQLLRRFVELKEELVTEHDADYIIIDTSPGIRHWSVNSLAVADVILLTLKMGDLDVKGTRKMAEDIYSSFTDFGAKSYLLMNRVAGFCVPNHAYSHEGAGTKAAEQENLARLSNDIGMDIMSPIPCYCDIQFSEKEFLTITHFPDHPFARQIESLANDQHIKE